MAKSTRQSSESKVSSAQAGDSTIALGRSVSKLVETYHSTVVEHFSQLAKEVETEPTIADQDKIETLYKAIESLFISIDRLSRSAPERAPELWRKRSDKSEKIFDFIRRVYAPYIGRIRRADLRRLDFSLYKSLYYNKHQAEYKNRSDLDLLTTREANDRLLAQLDGKISMSDIRNKIPAVLLDRLKLYETMATRKRRKKAGGQK